MEPTGWFTDSCPSTALLFSAKLENVIWHMEDLPAAPLLSALESHPRTFITLTPPRVPIDVEQALFSVTDVSFTVQNPHFPSISNGQVSVCTALEGTFQGTSDRKKHFNGPKDFLRHC